MISEEGAYTFVVPVHGKDMNLNLTMTRAPQTTGGSHLVEVFFNGLFDMPPKAKQATPLYLKDITDYPPRLQHSLSQQIWVHQDTFNSLIHAAGFDLFNFKLTSANMSAALVNEFKELKAYYGDNVTIAANFYYPEDNQPTRAISFDMFAGIVLNGKVKNNTADPYLVVDALCSNATTTNERCLSFNTILDAHANLTVESVMAYPSINMLSLSEAQLTYNVTELQPHNYTTVIADAFNATAAELNEEYKNGWSLANLDPRVAMLGGLIKNITVSPYITDNWMLAGFEMYADLPTEANPALEFI